jgi:hypothetical protein
METKVLAPHPPGGAHHRGYSKPGAEKVTQHQYDKEGLAKEREVCIQPSTLPSLSFTHPYNLTPFHADP